MPVHKKVIIAPLDWGLGHATRIVPIIRKLLEEGAEVEIASAECHRNFFSQEFPNLTWHKTPSYNIKYPRFGFLMPLWLFSQMFRIKQVMQEENKFLADLCNKNNYTHIISDNRFGFFNSKVKSIYITHQLRIAFPQPLTAFEKIGENWHKNIMKNFDEIWVPDSEEFPGLAGKLSHPSYKDCRIKYIGVLSRLACNGKSNDPSTSEFLGAAANPQKIDTLAIISGPEPHRTLFEKQVIEILSTKKGNHCIVRGIPNEKKNIVISDDLLTSSSEPTLNIPFQVYNHLSAEELKEKILQSNHILCRSGYSTIMDLSVLNSLGKATLFPTPGQTEQQYLARLNSV